MWDVNFYSDSVGPWKPPRPHHHHHHHPLARPGPARRPPLFRYMRCALWLWLWLSGVWRWLSALWLISHLALPAACSPQRQRSQNLTSASGDWGCHLGCTST
jgi:hypothetical protein